MKNDAQIEGSVVGSDSNEIFMEFFPEAKKVREAEFSDDDHDIIVNRKRFEKPSTHFSNVINSVEHSIIIKHQRKNLVGYNQERVYIEQSRDKSSTRNIRRLISLIDAAC